MLVRPGVLAEEIRRLTRGGVEVLIPRWSWEFDRALRYFDNLFPYRSILLKDLPTIFQGDPRLGAFGLALLFAGLGVEAAIFPLHTWLPDAYSAAPTAVSAQRWAGS